MQSWFIVLLVLGCISTVSTYQCYSCTNVLQSGCNDPFDSNGITKQDAAGYVCMKGKSTQDGVTTIVRGYGPVEKCPSGENGCGEVTEQGVTGTVCCCNSDLCNGATTFRQQSLVGYLVVGIIATIYYRFF